MIPVRLSYRYEFNPVLIVAIFLFTWYQHEISYQYESYRYEFIPVTVLELTTWSRTGTTFIPVRLSYRYDFVRDLACKHHVSQPTRTQGNFWVSKHNLEAVDMGGGTGRLPLRPRDVKRDLAMHVYLSYLSRFVHMEIMFAGTFSSHRGKAGSRFIHSTGIRQQRDNFYHVFITPTIFCWLCELSRVKSSHAGRNILI